MHPASESKIQMRWGTRIHTGGSDLQFVGNREKRGRTAMRNETRGARDIEINMAHTGRGDGPHGKPFYDGGERARRPTNRMGAKS